MPNKTVINELRIGSRIYKIKWITKDELTQILDDAGYDDAEEINSGAALHREMLIVISKDLRPFPQRAYETLWHERVHIIEDMCGRAAEDDGGWTEQIVDSTANLQASLDIQSNLVDLENLVIGNWDFSAQKEVSQNAKTAK